MTPPTPDTLPAVIARLEELMEKATQPPFDVIHDGQMAMNLRGTTRLGRAVVVAKALRHENAEAVAALVNAAPQLLAAAKASLACVCRPMTDAEVDATLREHGVDADAAWARFKPKFDAFEKMMRERDEAVSAAKDAVRMREALEKIARFSPQVTPEIEKRHEDACRAAGACSECKAARERKWPPSGLCDEHWKAIDAATRAREAHLDWEQAWIPGDLARAALAPAPDGEKSKPTPREEG